MLKGVGPSAALGRDTTMLREILDRTATQIDRDLTKRPEVEMELRGTLARTYHDLGLYQKMETMARRYLQLVGSFDGQESPAYADALHLLADALMHQGDLLQSEDLHRQGLVLNIKLLGPRDIAVATSLSDLATVLEREGKLTEAEALHLGALEIRTRVLGNDDPAVADSLSNLGLVFEREGKLLDAETLQCEALDMRQRLFGSNHPDVATSLHNLAGVLYHENSLAQAESMYRAALDILPPQPGPSPLRSRQTAGSRNHVRGCAKHAPQAAGSGASSSSRVPG